MKQPVVIYALIMSSLILSSCKKSANEQSAAPATDGKEAVAEIVKVLDQDKTLKLDINGYTDQSGNSSHNQQLSKDRADTVLNTIAQAGIDKNRLSAHGYGDSSPIASNDDEAGKAQNRRVELVKR